MNELVKRSAERFPESFMFQVTPLEYEDLKSRIATSSWGGRLSLPYVFTEHGAVMLASVLNSPRAIKASIAVVEVFVRLRQLLLSNVELSKRLDALEQKYDNQFKAVFDAIRRLMTPPEQKRRRIRFIRSEED